LDELEFRRVLKAAKKGDSDAFAVLYELVAPRIRGFVHTRGVDDPDGTTNEVFIRVFKSLTRFRGSESAFVGWVFQIARNRVIDESRSRKRRVSTISTDHDYQDIIERHEQVDSPIEEWHRDESQTHRLQQLLNHLSNDQAEVMTLRAIAGLSYEEIAQVTGHKPDNVRQMYRRARLALENVIEFESSRKETPE